MPTLWNVSGLSATHRPAVEQAVGEITFPWLWLRPKLKHGYGLLQIPVVTSDLSAYGQERPGEHVHEGEAMAHVLNEPVGRKRVAGLCWSNGKIEIANWCDAQTAKEVFSAEAAHAVDFFWMTVDQHETTDAMTPMRQAVWRAFHGGSLDSHGTHSWFDPAPYGDQVGEGWMALFSHAWSPYEPWQGAWSHQSTEAMGQAIKPEVETPAALVGLTGYTAVHRQSCRYVKAWRAKGLAFRQTRELAWHRLDLAQSWSGRRPCLTCRPEGS